MSKMPSYFVTFQSETLIVYLTYRNCPLIGLLFVVLTKCSMSLAETAHVSSHLTPPHLYV